MRCQIYGHTIVLAFKDSALHCEQKAGGGDFYSSNYVNTEDPEVFENLDQCLAFILATNW
jgi:hypothetical protein